MAITYTPDPETYQTPVVDPGTVATASAVGSGYLGVLGGLFGFLVGGPPGAIAGASIGVGVGGSAGTAFGTELGTTIEEFPVGGGPQGVALAATPGVNFNALGQLPWEDIFKDMDSDKGSDVASAQGGELYAHTMSGRGVPLPSPGYGFGVGPSAPVPDPGIPLPMA